MDSANKPTEQTSRAENGGGSGWVLLTSDDERFDIDSGRVQCRYLTPDFVSAGRGDVMVVVPAAFSFASQMIAHAVLPVGGGDGRIEIAVRRPLIRCARPYRFAYVDGRLCDVMAVSGTFAFVHGGRPCDCDDRFPETGSSPLQSIAAASAAATAVEPSSLERPVVRMSSFVSSLMDVRSSAPACSNCAVPSNRRQVMAYLTENLDRLYAVDERIRRLCKTYVGYTFYGFNVGL